MDDTASVIPAIIRRARTDPFAPVRSEAVQMLGMMTGLGVLKIYGYFLRRDEVTGTAAHIAGPAMLDLSENRIDGKLLEYYKPRHKPFDIFVSMKRAEWDTLLFFYGVILCVGGLGALGYLAVVSELIYTDLGPTKANVLVGFLSAVVDNVPITIAMLPVIEGLGEAGLATPGMTLSRMKPPSSRV